MTRPGHELSPEADAVVERYLDSVRAAMAGQDEEIVAGTIEGLGAHIAERLDADATREDAEALVRELGGVGSSDDRAAGDAGQLTREDMTGARVGRVLGIPYDLRVPTADRIADRWWNPRESRIWMPRAFGMGWDINFGALAVRLRLIEPDAEESPFAAVPARIFIAALAVPVVLTAFMIASYLWLLPELPAQLPSHWDIAGRPDDYAARAFAFGFLLLLAAAPTAYAIYSVAAARPPLNRGVGIAFAAFFSALSSSLWLLTLLTVFTRVTAAWLPLVMILGALLVPAGILLALARAGRAAEIRSDLEGGVR